MRRVAPYVTAVEKQARTVEIEVKFDEPARAGRLLVGYSADVEVVLDARKDVLRVPTSALLQGGRVLLLGADGRLEERTVKTGLANWEYTEVVAGPAGRRAHRDLARPRRRQGRRRSAVEAGRGDEVNAMARRRSADRARAASSACSTSATARCTRCARLDLRIAAGEYIAVMGPSGSGKSTLLNVLGLLDRPDAGTYRLEGRDVTTLSPDEQARVRSQRIGFVFQSFHLVPRLTAAENIALPMMLAGIAAARARARACRGRSTASAWPTAPTTGRTSSPAASASAWRSRARPSCSRRCCWPTSRPATSTAPPARRSCACWRS